MGGHDMTLFRRTPRQTGGEESRNAAPDTGMPPRPQTGRPRAPQPRLKGAWVSEGPRVLVSDPCGAGPIATGGTP